ncbi:MULTISPECIES: hypothetical protein [unclassified Corynebacterium]|uniref:hypothetical protein n=1 Tax=unclassified Corynebacterium TaxID=2624378 RepID=UPI00264E3DE7|nr:MULTISPECIES: hypothetical protein [unclassified Corynebacterium]MDN8593906.1 hypothetical protein [Corynebacterium sp. P4_F2]WKK56007.1 hypothetical protein QYR03_01935 [Corynebacterium sp. P4-C1]WKK63417.1 hypothetical protein QYR04_00425 [Corynebacterium sp. P8-C1]
MSESVAVDVDRQQAHKGGRKGWRKATPYVMIAVYLLAPLVLIPAVGEDNAAIPSIGLIFGTAALFGFIDGWTFRPTWSLPILAGVGFLLAKLLYFNDGTVIYFIGAVIVAAAFDYLAGLLAGTAGDGAE